MSVGTLHFINLYNNPFANKKMWLSINHINRLVSDGMRSSLMEYLIINNMRIAVYCTLVLQVRLATKLQWLADT